MSREELIRELSDAIRENQTAVDQVDEAAVAVIGINRTDLRSLDVLQRRGRVTAGELAEESGLTTGAVTALIDRLERAGLVRRVRDEHDRRRVFVEMTPEAQRGAQELYGPIGRDGAALMEGYTDEELAAFLRFLREGTQMLAGHIERMRALASERGAARKSPR